MILNPNERCAYAKEEINGSCKCIAITVDDCSGFNSKCSFFKTEAQHFAERNKAIDICRKKGICENCKYSNGKPCGKSIEWR